MDGSTLAVIASLVSLLVGFVLGYRRTYFHARSFQSSGEAYLSNELRSRFKPPNYHLLNHITLHTRDGTTQIDHILLSRFGVFVVENKDYSGWIFGDPKDSRWTQVLYRAKFRFQNPIHQNFQHVCAVQQLLDFLPPNTVQSSVVFTGDAEFKTEIPAGVFMLKDFLNHVESHRAEVMTINRLHFCVGRLEAMRLSVTDRTDVEHVQHLQRKYGTDD